MLDHNLVLKSNELYLAGNIETDGSRERATGLYARDTRHLSRFLVRINDVRPEVLTIQAHDASSAVVIGSNPLVTLANGETLLPQKVLIERRLTMTDRLQVDITIENFDREQVALELSIEIGADFRDLFDIRGFPRARRGEWRLPRFDERSVTLSYRGLDGALAATTVTFDRDATIGLATTANNRAGAVAHLPGMGTHAVEPSLSGQPEVIARFPVELHPGQRWTVHADVLAIPADGAPLALRRTGGRSDSERITTDDAGLNRVLRQSVADLDTLYTSFPHGSITAAGIPWFVAPFGRDSLIVGLQTYHLLPERAMDTVRMLAALQGAEVNPAKEEEPGKILHEMRYGEMARLHEVPHTPYFGSVDATPLFIWLFAEIAIWTGSAVFYRELKPAVERAFAWMEQYGDLDGDGFVEYRSDLRGVGHISNQVWKDSYDSLNHRDGAALAGPIAAVEVQGYAYAGYARVAEAAAHFGDAAWAAELTYHAEGLREAFEAAFWMDDEGCYAQALDGAKRQVRSIASNPGHLLLTGAPSAVRAARVADRLSQPDMESGWGVRTLSTGEPSYNPMSYHNGSIWPHDNSLIGAGAYRNGETTIGGRVFRTLLDAALTNADLRLPELYCGFAREGYSNNAPVPYPVSCIPQAWAAGAIPLMLRAALGLRVDAATQRLLVEPRLPEWLNRIEIRDLAVANAIGSLRVERTGDGYEIAGEGLPLAKS